MPVYVIASADLKSGYVFRTDVAYDFNVRLEDIEEDTAKYHCDHTYPFLTKNDRLKYSFCPQPPTKLDSQTQLEYDVQLNDFENRKMYVEGCQVNLSYTALAHYFLIKNSIKSSKWIFVSDDDPTLQSSIFKIYSNEFLSEKAKYFTCQYEKKLSLEEAGAEAFKSRTELFRWANDHRLRNLTLSEIAQKKLASQIQLEDFYDYKIKDGVRYPARSKERKIKHPLPDKDEGIRWVNLISYVEYLSSEELAQLILQVNSRAINNYFQSIRRHISELERPLVTARGDGKSYIYANYNPKYAQQLLTIFRTFYNFCWKTKVGKSRMTPAQRIGIADKVYDIKEIIYFR